MSQELRTYLCSVVLPSIVVILVFAVVYLVIGS